MAKPSKPGLKNAPSQNEGQKSGKNRANNPPGPKATPPPAPKKKG